MTIDRFALQNSNIMSGDEELEAMRWQYVEADRIIQKAVNNCAKKKVCAAVSVNRFLTKGLCGVMDVLETVMADADEKEIEEEFFRIVKNILDLRQEHKRAHKKGLN